MPRAVIAAACVASLTLSACRTAGGSQTLGVDRGEMAKTPTGDAWDDSVVVLVYMGGFGSCKAARSPEALAAGAHFEELIAAVERRGARVRTLRSCFDGIVSKDILWVSDGLAPKGAMADAEAIHTVSWRTPDAAGEIFDEVARLAEGRHPVYVMGHSYGGWLASNLVAHFGAIRGGAANGRTATASARAAASGRTEQVGGLFTIDPISPYHCNQALYAWTVAKWLLLRTVAAFRPPNSCEHAPSQYVARDDATYPGGLVNDVDAKLRGYVAAATAVWKNYYQTRDYLHSSAVTPQAGVPINRLIDFGSFLSPVLKPPHVAIHADDKVWSDIRLSVLASLAGEPVTDESMDGGGGQVAAWPEAPPPVAAWPAAPPPAIAPEDLPMSLDQAAALDALLSADSSIPRNGPLTPAHEAELARVVAGAN